MKKRQVKNNQQLQTTGLYQWHRDEEKDKLKTTGLHQAKGTNKRGRKLTNVSFAFAPTYILVKMYFFSFFLPCEKGNNVRTGGGHRTKQLTVDW